MRAQSVLPRAGLALALIAGLLAAGHRSTEEAPILGEGRLRFRWQPGWGRPQGSPSLGSTHGCVAVDSRGRIYVNTDTEQAIVVFSPDGRRLAAFGAELAGGLHGMVIAGEGDQESLYLAHTGRREVLKATLDGEVQWSVGWPEASGLYASAGEYAPTSIAVRPDGGFYVADGYGKSWIHQYDAERRWVRAFGGPGGEPGKLATPHGVWLDQRGGTAKLVVADRENGRLQAFDLEGNHLAVLATGLKRPCHLHPFGGLVAVPELAGGVAVLDVDWKLLARLGENPDPAKRATNQVPEEEWADGSFLSPHCASFDARGDLYVLDWSAAGRVSKLARLALEPSSAEDPPGRSR